MVIFVWSYSERVMLLCRSKLANYMLKILPKRLVWKFTGDYGLDLVLLSKSWPVHKRVVQRVDGIVDTMCFIFYVLI